MPLSAAQKRALAAQAHTLRPVVSIAAERAGDAAVSQVRQSFGRRPLIKIRIAADDKQACVATATSLAQRVPCELVQVVGRVALLYREPQSA